MDTIINFGENLRDVDLDTGFAQGKKADLMLCVGSSMRVTPAADMAAETPDNGGKLVIINLQKTPLDKGALCIHAKIDDVFELLMKKLDMKIPQFCLKRYGELKITDNKVFLSGIDLSGAPYSIFKSTNYTKNKDSVAVKVSFQGHYNEPELEFKVNLSDLAEHKNQTCHIQMIYSPFSGKWESVSIMNWKNTKVLNVLEHKNNKAGLAAPEKKEEVAKSSGSSARSRSTAASGRLNAPARKMPEKKTSPARLIPEKKEGPKRGRSFAPASRSPPPAPSSHVFAAHDSSIQFIK